MEFQVLGPLRVVGANGEVPLTAARERALLVRLLLDANRPVPVEQLIEDLWLGAPPPSATRTLRVYVSRLRKALGEPDRIATTDHGYRLRAEPREIDYELCETLLAADEIDATLALWRGPALADISDAPWARVAAIRLEDRRLSALERRLGAALEAGRHLAVTSELEELCAREPYRESLWSMLMLALHRAGRRADALAAYTRVRTLLVNELGLEPGQELRERQQAILVDDPALALSADRASHSEPVVAAPPGNLVRASTTYVDGEQAVDDLRAEVAAASGPLTLTGPPGAGKTRLALEAAAGGGATFPGGLWLLDLAPINDPGALTARLAGLLGVTPPDGGDPLEPIVERLSPARTLLIVDNCEHLLAASGSLIERLRARVPGLGVIATSRERLGIDAERVVAVNPLPAPPPGATAAQIRAAPASRLFIERAAAVGGEPDLGDPAVVAAVGAICRGLDGLPLALELAASRANILGAVDIAARLDDALSLLRTRRDRLPERQRTLRALIAWSESLLDADQRTLLRRLAAFTGGAPLAGVEAVCGSAPLTREGCLDALQALVERSLVVAETTHGEARYRLLETIRVYARERLREANEETQAAERHAAWCVAHVTEAERLWRAGEQTQARARFVTEQDNWAAALRYLVTRGDGAGATALAAPLGQWWYVSGRTAEGRAALDQVIALPAPPSRERAAVLRFAGALARTTGDFPAARRLIGDGIAVAEAIGDQTALLQLQISLGAVTWLSGDDDGAREILMGALEKAQLLGDRRAVGNLSYNLAVMARNAGALDEALARVEVAGSAWAEVGDERGQAIVHGLAASVLLRSGGRDEARRRLATSLRMLRGTPYLEAIVEQLETAAVMDAADGHPHRTAWLIGHADSVRAAERMLRPPLDDDDIQRTLRGSAQRWVTAPTGSSRSVRGCQPRRRSSWRSPRRPGPSRRAQAATESGTLRPMSTLPMPLASDYDDDDPFEDDDRYGDDAAFDDPDELESDDDDEYGEDED